MLRRLLAMVHDGAIRRVIKHGVPATLGRILTSVAGLVTMALLAHTLGPGPFGVVAVIRTVAGVIEQYANFTTWQAIVKYGTEAQASDRGEAVRLIVKLAVVIDLATAAAAGILVVGAAVLLPETFSWTQHEAYLASFYSLTVFTRVSGASDGIFRLCDAYRAQAIALGLSGVVMVIAVTIAFVLRASITGCVVALIASECIGNLIVTSAAFRIAATSELRGWSRAKLANVRREFPGVVRFLVTTNAQLTLKKTNSELDMMVVGAMLGRVPSGLYRVVKQLGTIPGRIFMPFEQVVFTELARASAVGDYRALRNLLLRFTTLVTFGSLVVWAFVAVAAEPIVRLVAGAEFVAVAPALRIYLLAMVLIIAAAPSSRALVALGRPGTSFLLELGSFVVIVPSVTIGAVHWGLEGVAGAILVHRIVMLITSVLLVISATRAHGLTRREPSPVVSNSDVR